MQPVGGIHAYAYMYVSCFPIRTITPKLYGGFPVYLV